MLTLASFLSEKCADVDPCDTDKACFFYKPHSIWLICLVDLIPGLGWLNLSISFSYQHPNRSTAGHWTRTRVLLLHRKSQRLRTGRGEVLPELIPSRACKWTKLKKKRKKKKEITMLFWRKSFCGKRFWVTLKYFSWCCHEWAAHTHTHTLFLSCILK